MIWGGGLTQDLRYAWRMIRKQPGFALIAVIALALGIGANSAVFSAVNALLLRPLALPDLDRLVEIRNVDPRRPLGILPVAPADYLEWKEHSRSFAGLSAYTGHDFDLAGDGEPENLRGLRVTTDLLRTLGARPALGRDFRPDEDQPGHDQVAILSDALWRQRFAADPAAIGRSVLLDSKPFVIIGVLPPAFDFPVPGIAIWAPLVWTPAQRLERRTQSMFTAARLRDGVSLEQARAEIEAQTRRQARDYPETNQNRASGIVLLRERQGEIGKPFLALLQGTALFVLLIACANLANLQLAKGLARRREIAVRAALGAGRWRVARLLLVESLLIAIAGGAVGVGVAYAGVAMIKSSIPPEASRNFMGWSQLALQPPVLVFTLVVAIASGIVFGTSSALHAARLGLVDSLKDGAQKGGSKSRMRRVLVIAEVALAVIAVMGASQMIRSFQQMFDVYQGFSPERILTARMTLPEDRYDTLHKASAFFDRTLQSIAPLPGVEAATVSSNLPGALRFNFASEIRVEGKAALSKADAPLADFQFVGPDYFRALQVPVLRGRPIRAQDGEEAPLVAVISDRLAERCWPREDPIGKRIRFDGVTPAGWRTVVGVVADVHQFWFDKEARPVLYLPYQQAPRRSMYLALRTRGNPMTMVPALRDRVRRLDATLPVADPKRMLELMQETMSAMRLTAGMMTTFGLLALSLASIGVYGVMAYSVAQRRREFGIRMALGARPHSVLRMAVLQGFAVTMWGIGAGLAGGLAISRAMAGIMFGVNSHSLAILAGAPLLLASVSLLASWIPARAVTHVDPVSTLRHD